MAREQRRLAAILAADVVGYSRLMGRDESGTLARLREHRTQRLEPTLARHGGRLVKLTGDGALAEFPSAVDALGAAIDFQQAMTDANHEQPEDNRVVFRIGLHLGALIVDGDDLYGDSVNVAARLEAEAPPGGIVISGNLHDAVAGRLKAIFDDLGGLVLKNIERPIQAFGVKWEPADWKVSAPSAAVPSITAAPLPTNLPLALPDKPSIAVLPFQNMSGDPEQEYFADGMVEDIITALSRTKSLFVIARNSSFAYKGKSPDIRQVGRELGVRYVLEGSVRRSGNRVRTTGQLIDASSGSHVWADRFDSALEDIFELQDQMTSSVVGAISPALERAEIERSHRKPTENFQAYDFYLRGMACTYTFTKEANQEALRFFHKAIELDPKFSASFALVANCYTQRKAFGWFTDRVREIAEAERAARLALELHGDDPRVLGNAGWALAWVVGHMDEGEAYLDQAIKLDPNYAVAFIFAGSAKTYLGKSDVAIEYLGRALRLSPLDPRAFLAHGGMARAHFIAGRYAEAAEWASTALRQRPNFVNGLLVSTASLAMSGSTPKAQQAYAVLRQLLPNPRIANIREWLPFSDDIDFGKFAKGLRLAGMPE